MFEPSGDRARWREAYELMARAEIGTTVTYAQLAEAMNLNPIGDRAAIQMAARRAGLELERVEKRAAYSVKNEGYRIAQPSDHLALGKRRARRSRTQVRRGELVTRNVDLNGMDDQTRQALETLARGFAVQGEINRRMLAKQQEHDDMIAMLLGRVERLEKDK